MKKNYIKIIKLYAEDLNLYIKILNYNNIEIIKIIKNILFLKYLSNYFEEKQK